MPLKDLVEGFKGEKTVQNSYDDLNEREYVIALMENGMDKKELRKAGLSRRKALSKEACRERSKVIASKVIELEEFKNSNRILLYAPIRNEVETEEIYREAKRLNKDIYYPRVQGKEMQFYFIDSDTEFENAMHLAKKRYERIKNEDSRKIYQKLSQHLAYKGFDYDIIKRVLNKLLSNDEYYI